MDAPIRTPSGSPLVTRGSPPAEPPALHLGAQERTQSIANRYIVYPLVNIDPFAEYLINYLKGPHDYAEVVKMIVGPQADHYRAIAAETLKDAPVASYVYIRLIENPLLQMELFERIAPRLAAVDAFLIFVEGCKLLTVARGNLCKLSAAFHYLSVNNIIRTVELYYLIDSPLHRRNLYQQLYEKAQSLENKQSLLTTIVQFHILKDEIDQAVYIITELCPDFDREACLFSLGEQLIQAQKPHLLPVVLNAMTHRKDELRALLPPPAEKKRKNMDPVAKAISDGLAFSDLLAYVRKHANPDTAAIAAFNSFLSKARFQEALFITREIKNPLSREACLKILIAPLAAADNFALLKELFILCHNTDDVKLSTALLYVNTNVLRSVEIFLLLTNFNHRVYLFSKMYTNKSEEEKSKIIWGIVGSFVDSGHVGLAITILKTQCPGIDADLEIFKVGIYLKSQGKNLDLVLASLTPARQILLRSI